MQYMQRTLGRALLLLAFIAVGQQAEAQISLKNNLLYDASLTPNIGMEVGLARKWTFDATFGLNPWTFNDNKKWRHWLVQPEARYWFCEKFNGHFVGLHLMGGEFNAGGVKFPFGIAPCLHHNRYEGWYAGGGLVYGYQWPVSRHFSVETVIGLGYDYLKYKKFPCEHCGTQTGEGHYNYIGPTKVALNMIYNL